MTDYRLRGDALHDYNVMRFFTETYEEATPHTQHMHSVEGRSTRGRIPNTRVPYLSGHPKSASALRVVRSFGHNTIPNFIGRYFPRRDDPDPAVHQFYRASMLILLKPWRELADLKAVNESWEEAFRRFLDSPQCSIGTQRILSNIQHFHRCQSSALEHAARNDGLLTLPSLTLDDDEEDEEENEPVLVMDGDDEQEKAAILCFASKQASAM